MSGVLKNSDKRCESAVTQKGSSMHFWGVCCESGKQYAQVVGQRFRITMAVLDPNSFHNDASERTVSLIVIRGGIEYLLCVLKHGEIHQVNLNLIFDKGENVKFYINGHGKVYLSGYQLTDSEGDVMNDENGYLCPLVEVKSKSKKSSSRIDTSVTESESGSSPKNKVKTKPPRDLREEKRVALAYLNEISMMNDSEDESDEDFSLNEDSKSSSSDEEELSSEEEIDEVELEELQEDQDFDSPQETRKRKKQTEDVPRKRLNNESFNKASSSSENSDDVICIEDTASDKETSSLKSCLRSTPMPEKQVNDETALSEKKSKKKKKKRLSEISNITEISVSEEQANKSNASTPKATTSKITPNTPKEHKHPVVKLEGGVEIQDVVVGKGPLAVNGKLLHVFFVGRLQDKTIFDSRLPGKKPFSFKLGTGDVIRGWDVAFPGMRVGGKRKIKIPPAMAYKEKEHFGIPPNSTLYFVVELQSVS